MANFINAIAMLVFAFVSTISTAASNNQPCQNKHIHLGVGSSLPGNTSDCLEWNNVFNSGTDSQSTDLNRLWGSGRTLISNDEQNMAAAGSFAGLNFKLSADTHSEDGDWLLNWSSPNTELPSSLVFAAFFKSEQGYREYLYENELLSLSSNDDQGKALIKKIDPRDGQSKVKSRSKFFVSELCAQNPSDPSCSSGQTISEPELLWIIGSALLVFVGFPRRFSKSI